MEKCVPTGPVVRPDFLTELVVQCKNAFPQKPFWRPWTSWFPVLRVLFCIRALRSLSNTALASHGSGDTDHVLVMQLVAGSEPQTHHVLEPTTNGSCGNAFFHRTTNAAGKVSRTTGLFSIRLLMEPES